MAANANADARAPAHVWPAELESSATKPGCQPDGRHASDARPPADDSPADGGQLALNCCTPTFTGGRVPARPGAARR